METAKDLKIFSCHRNGTPGLSHFQCHKNCIKKNFISITKWKSGVFKSITYKANTTNIHNRYLKGFLKFLCPEVTCYFLLNFKNRLKILNLCWSAYSINSALFPPFIRFRSLMAYIHKNRSISKYRYVCGL